MKNVDMRRRQYPDHQVDLSKEFGPSSSGKTIIIASTEGNVAVPEREEKVGLNIYKKDRTRSHGHDDRAPQCGATHERSRGSRRHGVPRGESPRTRPRG